MDNRVPHPSLNRAARAYHIFARVIGWKDAIDVGLRVWSEKRPPSSGPADPIHGGGVGVIYVPKKISERCGTELVRLAGKRNAAALSKALGGEIFEFPSLVPLSISHRNKAIAEQVASGWSVSAVAWGFDITPRQVRRICKAQAQESETKCGAFAKAANA